jgi:aminobenzoyl-glutamate utilization protein B
LICSGHNWANAIATPIAHKGVIAGAKVQAMTILDLLTNPQLVAAARDYFNKQTKDQKYVAFIRPEDHPHVELNATIMDKYSPQLKKFYYDASKYPTYLDQLGIKYPTLRTSSPASAAVEPVGSADMNEVVAAATGN